MGPKKINNVGQILPMEQMTNSISEFLQWHELLRYMADEALFYHIRQSVQDPPGDVFDHMIDTLINYPNSIATLAQACQYIDEVRSEWEHLEPGADASYVR